MQELASPPRASTTVIKCVTSSLEATYRYLFENCYEVYKATFEQEGEREEKAKSQEKEKEKEAGGEDADVQAKETDGENTEQNATANPTSTVANMAADPEQYGPDCTKNLNFWVHLIQLLEAAIDEDKKVYTQVCRPLIKKHIIKSLSILNLIKC